MFELRFQIPFECLVLSFFLSFQGTSSEQAIYTAGTSLSRLDPLPWQLQQVLRQNRFSPSTYLTSRVREG